MRSGHWLLGIFSLAVLATPAGATINAQSDGSDGALVVNGVTAPSGTLTIDLGRAATQNWNQASPVAGAGVYDSTKWAVVFKYTSVNIVAGYALRFTNHPANAPVVWLVQGVADVAGTINLDGESSNGTNRETVPGPGGFPGGRGAWGTANPTAGQGPGGAPIGTVGYPSGSYASPGAYSRGVSYGNIKILPLIGGSGGAGIAGSASSGGAGGGAILIVAGRRIALNGFIRAVGGSYGGSAGEGSGGAVRLLADTLAGNGVIYTQSWNGNGGYGRVRLEANIDQYSSVPVGVFTLEQPLDADGVVIWPSDLAAPESRVRIVAINNVPVTGDPHMDAQALASGDATTALTSNVPVNIEAFNLPLASTVSVRVVLGADPDYTTAAAFSSGDATHSYWLATLPALSPNRVSALQVKAILH